MSIRNTLFVVLCILGITGCDTSKEDYSAADKVVLAEEKKLTELQGHRNESIMNRQRASVDLQIAQNKASSGRMRLKGLTPPGDEKDFVAEIARQEAEIDAVLQGEVKEIQSKIAAYQKAEAAAAAQIKAQEVVVNEARLKRQAIMQKQ